MFSASLIAPCSSAWSCTGKPYHAAGQPNHHTEHGAKRSHRFLNLPILPLGCEVVISGPYCDQWHPCWRLISGHGAGTTIVHEVLNPGIYFALLLIGGRHGLLDSRKRPDSWSVAGR